MFHRTAVISSDDCLQGELLSLLCQGIYNIINGIYMCKPVMHQMKLNQFKPGWLPLYIVFHPRLCKINGFGDNTIPYYFREILYLKVTVE